MKERIWQFLQSENKSSSQFADEIGVQPSGISHIISGRNNPSLDFIIKMLTRYQYLSPEWLLFGKGKMYKESEMPTLFDDTFEKHENSIKQDLTGRSDEDRYIKETIDSEGITNENQEGSVIKRTEKIVYFFNNGTFREYFPGKM
jgi:transcriptional regulator with XRE-family HTH domain